VSLRREYPCFKCKKTGHIARNCRVLGVSSTGPSKSVSRSEEEMLKKRTSEVALSATIMEEMKISEYMWLGDFSTAYHVTNSLEGFYDA